jgi:sRNA-binding carbon storage regulator CsrA
MTEQKNQLASLFAACWKDEALKARFMSDPKAVLAEYDMPVPDGMDVKVVENADNCVHITMPAPPTGHMELSDEELSNAKGRWGGKGVGYASLFAACWKDEALKARLMSDPKAVLAEYDMPVPDGMDVKVVENADNCVHITMPAPPTVHMELSDEELSNAKGGGSLFVAWMWDVVTESYRLTC